METTPFEGTVLVPARTACRVDAPNRRNRQISAEQEEGNGGELGSFALGGDFFPEVSGENLRALGRALGDLSGIEPSVPLEGAEGIHPVDSGVPLERVLGFSELLVCLGMTLQAFVPHWDEDPENGCGKTHRESSLSQDQASAGVWPAASQPAPSGAREPEPARRALRRTPRRPRRGRHPESRLR